MSTIEERAKLNRRNGRPRKLTAELEATVVQTYVSGLGSIRDLARAHNVSTSVICAILRRGKERGQ